VAPKELKQGQSTAFYEIEDIVTIDAKQPDGIQRYVS
jgi:hypothetical protein